MFWRPKDETGNSHSHSPVRIEAVLREPAFPVGTELPHGIGKTVMVRATATVDGMRLAEILPIVTADLQIGNS